MRAGLDPAQFWRSTFREVAACIEERGEADRLEHNDRAWMAWHIAALSRMKKLPKLAELLIKPRKAQPVRPQTWQEQQAIWMQWVVATKAAAARRR